MPAFFLSGNAVVKFESKARQPFQSLEPLASGKNE